MNYRQAIEEVVMNKCIEHRGDSYRAYIYDDGKNVIGTYPNSYLARRAMYNRYVDRFDQAIFAAKLNPFDGVVIFDNYVIFKEKRIFNLRGYEMMISDECGGRPHIVYLNGRPKNFKSIYEQVFGAW